MSRELIKKMLFALDEWSGLILHQYTGTSKGMTYLQCCDNLGQEAITAAREYLAQPEKEPVAEVLWYDPELYSPDTRPRKVIDASLEFMKTVPLGTKLYTHPAHPEPVTPGIEQIAGAISKHITTKLFQREVLAAAQYIYHRYCTYPAPPPAQWPIAHELDATRAVTDSSVTPEYLAWLKSLYPARNGVGGNEAWNAGIEWARKTTPLTDEQIDVMWSIGRVAVSIHDFARAIEAAHGIGGEK